MKNGIKGIFKPFLSNYKASRDWKTQQEHEVAAYKMDKLLGINLVPPTILRSFKINNKSVTGSFQLYINGQTVHQASTQKHSMQYLKTFNRDSRTLRFFDYLIENCDRHSKNIMVDKEDKSLIAIDNGLAFTTQICDNRSKKIKNNDTGYSYKSLLATFDRNPPPELIKNLSLLSKESIINSFTGLLTQKEISSLLYRRDVLLKHCGY